MLLPSSFNLNDQFLTLCNTYLHHVNNSLHKTTLPVKQPPTLRSNPDFRPFIMTPDLNTNQQNAHHKYKIAIIFSYLDMPGRARTCQKSFWGRACHWMANSMTVTAAWPRCILTSSSGRSVAVPRRSYGCANCHSALRPTGMVPIGCSRISLR